MFNLKKWQICISKMAATHTFLQLGVGIHFILQYLSDIRKALADNFLTNHPIIFENWLICTSKMATMTLHYNLMKKLLNR